MGIKKLLLSSFVLFLFLPVFSFCQSVPVEELKPILLTYELNIMKLENIVIELKIENDLLKSLFEREKGLLQKEKMFNVSLNLQLSELNKLLSEQKILLINYEKTISDSESSSRSMTIKISLIVGGVCFTVGMGLGLFLFLPYLRN